MTGKPAVTVVAARPETHRAMSTESPAVLDSDSRAWIDALTGSGPARDEAIARLHALLLRAARFEVSRRAASLDRTERDDLALQSADDALVAVLAKLEAFRGRSRFSTWAYKFAIYETAVKVRRRRWAGRELPLEPEAWDTVVDRGPSPARRLELQELLTELREAIERDLTPHQREVVVALTLNEVPIDVLAERLNTTRGALYKTLHDGRRKLRASVTARGHQEWA